MKKGEAGIWTSLVGIILFVAAAYLTLQVVVPAMSGFQGSFQSTVCKFNAWMRASTVGNPLFESIIGASDFITGGMGGQIVSSVSVPLVCVKSPPLPSQDSYPLKQVVEKISRESVNCWDQFGLGKWDPLVLSPGGQSFTCYEQILPVKCNVNDIYSLWDEKTSDLVEIVSSSGGNFSSAVFYYYLQTHSLNYAGITKTYADMLPDGAPVIKENSFSTDHFVCNGKVHNYQVSIYFVDKFMGSIRGSLGVPLLCAYVNIADLGGDTVYMCIMEVKNGV